jgi:hypothetical protein
MGRMNWSRVQRDKSLKNPPRPELDSPISAKGRHPVPAPPPPPKAAPPENAPPKDLLPAARRPKPRRRRLKTPRPGRQRTTFTCGSCRRELPISERSVGFPKRCSSCVRWVPPAPIHDQSSRRGPAEPQGPDRRWRLAPTIHRALRGRPSTAPRRAPDSRRQGRDVAGVLHLRLGPPGLVSEEAECPALGRAAPLAGGRSVTRGAAGALMAEMSQGP